MAKTYILGNNQLLKELGGVYIEIPILNTNEEDKLHDWIIPTFKNNEIEQVIIEIGENPLVALQIGYQIRLSLEELQKKTLIPLLFVSRLSLTTVMIQSEIYSHILATKGVVFSEIDLKSIRNEMHYLVGLNESEYLTKFLKIIHIQPDETVGRHSLANIWGAHAMDKASNAKALPPDIDFKKKLYFKYISAFNNIYKLKPSSLKVLGNIAVGSVNKIYSEGKRILLIDDEADKGWEIVLRKILKTTKPEDFVVINEKVKDFESFSKESKRIIETEIFDLYLIDLRLNGLEEDENLVTKEFSGMKVLQKIKSLNEGYQVMVFTASNKVWNLKTLLDEGADGYYLKESPEYNFSKKISEQNYNDFKENVEKCFKRGYLKKIFKEKQDLICSIDDVNYDSDFKETIKSQLSLAYYLLSKSEKKEEFAYAYVSLYMIIETINSYFINQNEKDKYWYIDNQKLRNWTYSEESRGYVGFSEKENEETGEIYKVEFVLGNKPPEWQKMAGLYFQKWNGKNHTLIQELYHLIIKRNGFIHNDKEILDKTTRHGIFINQDIYQPQSFIKLFEVIKKILGYFE